MSSSGSDWMSKGNRSPIASLAESLLVSISEITASVACVGIEQENFFEFGCNLYRVSPVIMELQSAENPPTYITDILQSLSKSIILARDLVRKCKKGADTVLYPDTRSIAEQLEGVIKQIGEGLSLIPASAFEDQGYPEIAVQSLTKEMKSAHFEFHFFSSVELSNAKKDVQMETDLYSVDYEDSMVTPDLSERSHLHLDKIPESTNSSCTGKNRNRNYESLMTLPPVARYMEPLYETFFCPLTMKIMDDPVTVESGITYERKAITEWCQNFENPEEIFCPETGLKLVSKIPSTNTALKATIEEWEERNETERIKAARAVLSLSSTEDTILEALEDLRIICQRKQYNKVQLRNIGMIPGLTKFLEYKDRNVRCASLELLKIMAEDDDESKEMITKTIDISRIIKMLLSNHQPIKHAILLLLVELSRPQPLCDIIGSVTGAILMLITVKYRWSIDAFASEKADEILRNLERSSDNIKCMAENGHLEPLLNHIIEGSEEMKMKMASYLGEIVFGNDRKTYVAKRASPALIKMVHSGNTLTRNAAFKALKQMSSYHPNGEILVKAGIVKIMLEEMFTRTIHNEPMNSKKEATAILANILESGPELEHLQVNTYGHIMDSDYIVHDIINTLRTSTPDELNINLIRILLCLVKSPKLSAIIVSVVKETEASSSLIELVNNPNEELGIASIKMLISLSPFMGHTLAERLCKSRGQPESLLSPPETLRITNKQAYSANFLAKLPHQNLTLNQALLSKNAVPIILENITQIQRRGTRSSRYASAYLEGLVGVLVRFTATLYDPQMLLLARDYNLTLVFTELLMETSSDEVQRLSAIALENLSSQSVNLSKPPQIKKTKGVCSSQDTFCLVDAKAVEKLLACLDRENVEVVEAALSAICTLLDDKVDVDKSVIMLSEVNAIQHVMNVVKEHREEGLWKKSFWVIERFLMKGGDKSASDISQDRLLPATLVSAFHHGDVSTSQMAEKILRHLNKMPNTTTNFTM